MVLVRSHAERIVVLLGDEVVADHPRNFRRDQIIYDPWHYLPVLMKAPEDKALGYTAVVIVVAIILFLVVGAVVAAVAAPSFVTVR